MAVSSKKVLSKYYQKLEEMRKEGSTTYYHMIPHLTMVDFLLKHGADLNRHLVDVPKIEYPINGNWNCDIYAVWNNHHEAPFGEIIEVQSHYMYNVSVRSAEEAEKVVNVLEKKGFLTKKKAEDYRKRYIPRLREHEKEAELKFRNLKAFLEVEYGIEKREEAIKFIKENINDFHDPFYEYYASSGKGRDFVLEYAEYLSEYYIGHINFYSEEDLHKRRIEDIVINNETELERKIRHATGNLTPEGEYSTSEEIENVRMVSFVIPESGKKFFFRDAKNLDVGLFYIYEDKEIREFERKRYLNKKGKYQQFRKKEEHNYFLRLLQKYINNSLNMIEIAPWKEAEFLKLIDLSKYLGPNEVYFY